MADPGDSSGSTRRAGGASPARRYRRVALGLGALGVAGGVAAALVPPGIERQTLVAFAGVGLYGAVLVTLLRPPATRESAPSERVYDALAATGRALQRDVGLPDRYAYVPTDTTTDAPTDTTTDAPTDAATDAPTDTTTDADMAGFAPVYLVVRGESGPDPLEAATDGLRPVLSDRADGIVVYPTGAALFDAYEDLSVVDLEDRAVELADQLAEAAVAGLDLAGAVEPAVDPDAGRATVTVRDPRFGAVTRFDHPAASFFAVGLAVGLDATVTTTTADLAGDEPGGRVPAYRVVCEWMPSDRGERDGRA